MKLLALSIDGFRGIQHAIIRFGEHDVVVGPNGFGKNTIIDALSLVFGRTRLVRDLTEHDFYGSCPEATSRIRIVARRWCADSARWASSGRHVDHRDRRRVMISM